MVNNILAPVILNLIQNPIKKITTAVVAMLLLVAASFVPLASVHAVNVLDAACKDNADSAVCKSKDEGAKKEDAAKQVQGVVNLILMGLGIVAVIMIIIGGVRYTTSNGDPAGIKQGKDTVIYACVGLVVAMLSYAIVSFFVSRFVGQ